MPYTFSTKIRFSQTGEDRRLTLPVLVDLFQDCATEHAAALGDDIDSLRGRKRIWMLTSWQIVVDEYPFLDTEVQVQTWPCRMSSLLAFRNFRLLDKSGEKTFASALTQWAYVDSENGQAAHIDEGLRALYAVEEELPLPKAGRHVLLPDEMMPDEPIPVRYALLDANHHVNNGCYVELAYGLLPDGRSPKGLRVEYKKSAAFGEVLCPLTAQTEDAFYVTFRNAEGETLTNIAFEGEIHV